MPSYDEFIVSALFFALVYWEYINGSYRSAKRPPGDWWVDALSFVQLALIKPVVVLIAYGIAQVLIPESKSALGQLPFWLGLLIVFLPDDFSHYWIHRLAHEQAWLWGCHQLWRHLHTTSFGG